MFKRAREADGVVGLGLDVSQRMMIVLQVDAILSVGTGKRGGLGKTYYQLCTL